MNGCCASPTDASWIAALLCALGCVGQIPESPGAEPTHPTVDETAAPPENGLPLGTMPVRRLTRLELTNTLGQLLGTEVEVPADLPSDVTNSAGFLVGGSVSRVEAGILMSWTGQIATAAVQQIGRLVPCRSVPAVRAAEDACARDFIGQFGRRAFRRPLTGAEIDELAAYYQNQLRGQLGHDFQAAIRGLIQLMLQSPRFLYRWELGPAGARAEAGRIRLDAHEMASRLSYFLWASMPDARLFAEADANRLTTPEQIEAQARRMLDDEKARAVIQDFHMQWLEIGDVSQAARDPKKYGLYSPELGRAMMTETREFVSWAFGTDGHFETLLTSPVTFVGSIDLARLYSYAGFTGSTPKPVTLSRQQRLGILTHASFLTSQTLPSELNAIKRGKVVVEKLLCTTLPSPPAMVPEARPPMPNQTSRERLDQHADTACARACHGLFDPVGFAFEHYDSIGAYRTLDMGKRVDASGTITLPTGETQAFQDALDLSRILAGAPDVQRCFARQWFRYGLRHKEVPGEAPSFAAAERAFSASAHDMRELVVAITRTPAFLYRAPSDGEVLR